MMMIDLSARTCCINHLILPALIFCSKVHSVTNSIEWCQGLVMFWPLSSHRDASIPLRRSGSQRQHFQLPADPVGLLHFFLLDWLASHDSRATRQQLLYHAYLADCVRHVAGNTAAPLALPLAVARTHIRQRTHCRQPVQPPHQRSRHHSTSTVPPPAVEVKNGSPSHLVRRARKQGHHGVNVRAHVGLWRRVQ
jgi:hypothetical protein